MVVLLIPCAFVGNLFAQTSYSYFPTSSTASSVASADFNRDGNPDIAGGSSSGVDILIATGKGTYGPVVTYATPVAVGHIETPDINNDGAPDLVFVGSDNTVGILLNNGNGTFRPGTSITTSAPADWVVAGDLNNDGNVDLVVQERLSSASQFVIYRGHGDGTFTAGQVLNMSHFSDRPIVEDFNGDGKLDIANAEVTKVLIWPGKGDGTFGVPSSIAAPHTFDELAAADFNNDGIPDLAIVYNSNTCGEGCAGPPAYVSIYKNNGHAQFTLVSTTNFGAYCEMMPPVAADTNGDGKIDLNLWDPTFRCGFASVGLGNGAGGFSKLVSGPGGGTTDILYRDLNLDSRHDVAFGASTDTNNNLTVGLATNGFTNCPPPGSSTMGAKICTPGSSTTSPFILRASGNSPSGIKRLEVWIDGVKRYQKWNDQLAK